MTYATYRIKRTSAGRHSKGQCNQYCTRYGILSRNRALGRFYRILGSQKNGYGLGLAIVKKSAQLLKTRLEFHNGPENKGLMVEIQFTPQYQT